MQQAPKELPNTYFVIGESRTNADNAITKIYGSFYVAFEVDGESEAVLGFQCTHTLGLTEDFLRQWFVGQSFPKSVTGWSRNWNGGMAAPPEGPC